MIGGVRNFKLINQSGNEYDMTRPEALLHNPSGLGWGTTPNVIKLGNSYTKTSSVENRPSPSGEMVFRTYEEYKSFLEFCQVGGLVLAYKPIDVWYYLDVEIDIDKSEIKPETQHLICPINFTATGLWHESVVYQKSQPETGGKKYSYSYPYIYSDVQPGVVKIKNGNIASFCRIHILGPVENPKYVLYKNSKVVADGKILCNIPIGRKLVIDSNPANLEISEYTSDNIFIQSRYQDSDFETDRIINLPAGDSQLAFTHDGDGFVNAFVEVKKRV